MPDMLRKHALMRTALLWFAALEAARGLGSGRSHVRSRTAMDATKIGTEPIVLPANAADMQQKLAILHTSAHVMAMAVQNVFPGTQVTIGPTRTGEEDFTPNFYRPGELKFTRFSSSDLAKVQSEMDRIVADQLPVKFDRVSRAEAWQMIESQPADAPMKLEALGSIEDATVAICRIGDEWWNPCFCWCCRRSGTNRRLKL